MITPLLLSLALPWTAAEQGAVQRYCVGCHNTRNKTAGLALDGREADGVTREKVIRRLRARSMPPAGLPRPDEAGYRALAASLETAQDRAYAAAPDPGRPDTFRRLTRTEYRNAIRDLLALDADVANLLPTDEMSHGFDNVTVGELSPALLERYLGAARKISRLALGIPPKGVNGDTITLPPDLTQEEQFDKLPLGTRGGAVVPYTFPVDGVYEIQLRLQRDRNEHVEGLNGVYDVDLMLDGERLKLFTVTPVRAGQDHSKVDQHLNIRVTVKAGPHELAVAFPRQGSPVLETERQPYQAHFNMDRHPRLRPALYSVTINGPYETRGVSQTPSRRRLLICSTADEACATRILATVARRAYRRPVTAVETRRLVGFWKQAQSEGFEHGIEMALRAVLVSPEFLFRVERDPAGVKAGAAYRLSDLELATRLSFFLWSSIPDDELLGLAERGLLRQPAVLEKQARRMLADPRSRTLITNFASQWLYLRNLDSIMPDMRRFAGFDDNLRQAFRQETEMFVESVLREDRSALDLVKADYTFVNERLARHYGIPHVLGSRFRRVQAPGRGGLLRHGSILMVTSYPTRTSPVIRGKWILENLLGTPPPAPPPNVPALKEDPARGLKVLSMRERLKEHRENPACASCHQLIDPVGFALENFDAVGRWREMEDGRPVDAAGGFPDGSQFNGVDGLEKALLARSDSFLGTVAEKLLTYGLGRGVEPADGPAVRAIVREAQARNAKLSELIVGVTRSVPFRMRRTADAGATPRDSAF